jgi:polar amino acid transport system substrate-binding protein
MRLKFIRLFFLFFLSISLPTVVFAEGVIVVTENFPPYNYEHEGKIVGLSTDIVKRIMNETGLDYKIELLPWDRAYRMALNQDNVLIYTTARTAERENLFHWIALLGEAEFYLMGRSEEHYEGLSLPQLIDKGYKATCVHDDAACGLLKDAGFDEEHIEVVRPNSEILMVLFKKADFFVADPVELGYRLQQLGISDQKVKKVLKIHKGYGYYLAAGKLLKSEILVRIKIAYDRLKAKGVRLDIPAQ